MSNWPYPHIVAHRGGGKLAPENTLAAIDVGARYERFPAAHKKRIGARNVERPR